MRWEKICQNWLFLNKISFQLIERMDKKRFLPKVAEFMTILTGIVLFFYKAFFRGYLIV